MHRCVNKLQCLQQLCSLLQPLRPFVPRFRAALSFSGHCLTPQCQGQQVTEVVKLSFSQPGLHIKATQLMLGPHSQLDELFQWILDVAQTHAFLKSPTVF